MANREPLKDMQARLSERLRFARTATVATAWLAVTAGRGNYLLPLRQAAELLPISQWQAVPHTKPWFLGVMNIRGSLFGTVDLAQFISHVSGTDGDAGAGIAQDAAAMSEGPASVVTVNPAIEVNCALQVNGLAGLRSGDAFASSKPAHADAPPFFGLQFFDAGGARWQEIDLQILSRSPQFLNISE